LTTSVHVSAIMRLESRLKCDFSHKSVRRKAFTSTYMTVFSIHPGMENVSIHKQYQKIDITFTKGVIYVNIHQLCG
jgi:hypothetical protein